MLSVLEVIIICRLINKNSKFWLCIPRPEMFSCAVMTFFLFFLLWSLLNSPGPQEGRLCFLSSHWALGDSSPSAWMSRQPLCILAEALCSRSTVRMWLWRSVVSNRAYNGSSSHLAGLGCCGPRLVSRLQFSPLPLW